MQGVVRAGAVVADLHGVTKLFVRRAGWKARPQRVIAP